MPVQRFNSIEDLEFCDRYSIPLCLDTAHAALCVNAGRISLMDFFGLPQSLIAHSHIAGANGIDAEGVSLAEADVTCRALVEWVMHLPTLKILETWQGHLSKGKGFTDDLVVLHALEPRLT